MKHIGRTFEYYTSDGQRRTARCTGIEFHQLLGKPIFIGVSAYGNTVRLSKDEVKFIGGKKK